MSEEYIEQPGAMGAYVRIVKGGNRMFEIRAHVVCRDSNGNVKWEDDAVCRVALPYGSDVPDVKCEDVKAVLLGRHVDFLENPPAKGD